MAERTVLVRGGHVVDPALGLDGPADVLIRGDAVAAVGAIDVPAGARSIDAYGLLVVPGLIDVHVHLREPGFAAKETLESGTAAAAAGGFTTVFCMPNTRPALDSVEAVRWLNDEIGRRACVRVRPIAAITKERAGEEAVDFHGLAALGVAGFSDDGDTTADSSIVRGALAASRQLDLPVMVHCEDKALARGAMHEGDVSRRLGIPGIPPEAEEIVIARDVMLARLTGGWLHVCHVSTGRGAELVWLAKAGGARVTAEVTPHHLTLTDEWVGGSRRLVNADEPEGPPGQPGDPDTKVNPPLRPEADAAALLAALRAGVFDLVATDHAPHAVPEKQEIPFDRAAFGFTASELALPTMLALVRAGHLSLRELVYRMATVPARLWKLPTGTLAPGAPADVVLIDPNERWVVSRASLRTKSVNTPLLGMEMRGRAVMTFVGGEERYRA
jgi:dihydroorotase